MKIHTISRFIKDALALQLGFHPVFQLISKICNTCYMCCSSCC